MTAPIPPCANGASPFSHEFTEVVVGTPVGILQPRIRLCVYCSVLEVRWLALHRPRGEVDGVAYFAPWAPPERT